MTNVVKKAESFNLSIAKKKPSTGEMASSTYIVTSVSGQAGKQTVEVRVTPRQLAYQQDKTKN